MQTLTSEEAEGVLEEFYQMAIAHDYVVKGGIDYARKMLINAFGPEQAKRMLDRLMKTLGNETLSFDALQKTDPQQLAKFIHSEHPQTIALILSHLNPSQAAGLLFSLPPEMRADVALRMANLDQISPEIISKIAGVIGSEAEGAGRDEPRSRTAACAPSRKCSTAWIRTRARTFSTASSRTNPQPGARPSAT